MYLARYSFAGNPTELRSKYAVLHEQLTGDGALRIVVERPDGLDVYDACPSEHDFREFSASAGFRAALSGVGLPAPHIEPLGEVVAVDRPPTAGPQ